MLWAANVFWPGKARSKFKTFNCAPGPSVAMNGQPDASGGYPALRLFFGPGYRVYFGEENDDIIILLNGGGKGSQQQDIEAAKGYWKEYKDNA